MAGKRVHEASNMAALFQNQGISAVGIKALIASGSSPCKIKDPTSKTNAEDIHGNMLGKSFYHHPLTSKEIGDEDLDERFHRPEKKMRLTADQIQLLEKSFELENRLEPERKNQLAEDLGVQPRQVGIWFQNRRARCKTKQLEKDYEALKSSYNVLKSEYDNDLIEKEELKAEVLQLTEKLILKGKDKCSSGEDELRRPTSQLQNPEAKKLDTAVAACNQEELSSVNSPIFDSNRLHCNNEAGLTANAFGPDHSDLTYLEDGEVEGYSYLKLEENSFNCGFPIEDRCFWFWP